MPTSHGMPPGQPPLAQARATSAKRRLPSGTRSLLEWGIVIAVAVVLALLVRSYVVQTFFIPSISMEPTLNVGDRILVFKAAYDFTSPAVGDVIVFHAPNAEHQRCSDPGVQDLVKRIIATPGQTIWSKGSHIYYENPGSTTVHLLKQPWQHTATIGQAINRETVPPSSYFVMGDNRPESCDSRVWGYVPRANIIGKAILIFWPLSRLSTI